MVRCGTGYKGCGCRPLDVYKRQVWGVGYKIEKQ